MNFTLNHFSYLIGGWVILSRFHVYRAIRSYFVVAVIALLIYRQYNIATQEASLLVLLQQFVDEGVKRLPFSCNGTSFLIQDILALVLLQQVVSFTYHLTNWNFHGFFKFATDYGFNLVKDLSFVKGTLEVEQVKLEQSFDKDLKVRSRAIGEVSRSLPEKGLQKKAIISLIEKTVKSEHEIWENGHLSGAVYGGQQDHIDFLNQCYSYYSIANPLHPDIWPSVMKFEAEIIAMTASLVNGGNESVCGSTTSVSH